MRIKHISDTHGIHQYLDLSETDVLVFTGDESNHRNPVINENEFFNWLEWFSELKVDNKLYIPGNHSSFVFRYEQQAIKLLEEHGITFMHQKSHEIDGIKFYGEATSPRYGEWFYMAKRHKMQSFWELIPEDTQVLLTHTPPKGILDLSTDPDRNIVRVGCASLAKAVKNLPYLKLHCFGHIHDHHGLTNHGLRIVDGVTFSNGAVVEDGRFGIGWVHSGININI